MVITDKIFAAYLMCSTKCWLLFTGQEGVGDVYPNWVQYRGSNYREKGVEQIVVRAEAGALAKEGSEFDKVENAEWKYAIGLNLTADTLHSEIHFLERIPPKFKNQPPQIIPGRFVYTNKLSPTDKLLLAFDALVLSKILRCNVTHGKLIHGRGYTITKIKTSLVEATVRNVIAKVTRLVSGPFPPDLVLKKHCNVCEYQTVCRSKAIEKDDLSLLAGMSVKERQKYNSEGIFTITQLSYVFRPRRHSKRWHNHEQKYRHSLKALAIKNNKIHVVGNLELKIEGTPVYFDVEGLPDRDFYYLIGIRVGESDSPKQYSLWADKLEDEKHIWWDLLKVIEIIDQPVLVHYGSYETKFLKDMCVRYGAPSPSSKVGNAISTAVNLQSFIHGKVYFPVFSNTLKEIAKYCGFAWSSPHVSGLVSIVWRENWETSRDAATKARLITYNSEDCEALNVLVMRLITLSTHVSSTEFVNICTLQSYEYSGFKSSYILPEFDIINKASYWDYQRDRVHLERSSNDKVSCKPHKGKNPVPQPNQVIHIPHNPTACPRCGSSRIYSHGFRGGKFVVDIKFKNNGIEKWIKRYIYKPHRCLDCRAVFLPNNRPIHKYGFGLVGYVIYQSIDLMVPLHAIEKSLNKILSFNFTDGSCNNIKEHAAKYYEHAYISIFHSLCEGTLIHVDETKIDTDMESRYVWVLANHDNVIYFSTASREIDCIRSLLNEFKGVMVTDFYAAYDGVNCKQQKCLIHLMRDINNDLYKHPFDEGLKQIAELFKCLLCEIIETIRLFGLKSLHHEKHLVSVDSFYDKLHNLDLSSDTAIKLKARFEKYKTKLFLFLRYDDVPWNNNNAEHAIKPFAILRNIIKGSTSEKGLHEYLILLSIRETCRYRGVDFLEFLLSGETNINAFATNWKRQHSEAGT